MIRQEDVSISYLPLAHMFERMIQVVGPLLRLFFLCSVCVCVVCTVNPKLKSISVAGLDVLPRGQSRVLPRRHFSSHGRH